MIKVFASLFATTPTVFADSEREVHNYWDRGLLGFTLDPNFPTNPYVYVMYAYDAPIGGAPPTWGDACPDATRADDGRLRGQRPPGPAQADGNVMTGNEQVLINGWCQQYPSHSVGELQFGPDGALYVSGGDGASWTFPDYGQVAAVRSPPVEPVRRSAGRSRRFDVGADGRGRRAPQPGPPRPSGEPVRLNGALLRLDPATGNGLPDNPLAGSSNANARRIVGYGFRNPFRFTFRPGTNEVWIGDVGSTPGRRSIGSRTRRPRRWRTLAGRATRAAQRSLATRPRASTSARRCTPIPRACSSRRSPINTA